MFTTLLNFCSNDLSAFYFDIRKDVIYCDNKSSINRRSSRTLLNIIFNHLVRWFAPSISFTTEEAWKAMGNKSSIHLEDFIDCNTSYENDEIKQGNHNLNKTTLTENSKMTFLDNNYNNDFTGSLDTSLLQKISKDYQNDYIIKNHSNYLIYNCHQLLTFPRIQYYALYYLESQLFEYYLKHL